jgi:hypothetical protein
MKSERKKQNETTKTDDRKQNTNQYPQTGEDKKNSWKSVNAPSWKFFPR